MGRKCPGCNKVDMSFISDDEKDPTMKTERTYYDRSMCCIFII